MNQVIDPVELLARDVRGAATSLGADEANANLSAEVRNALPDLIAELKELRRLFGVK